MPYFYRFCITLIISLYINVVYSQSENLLLNFSSESGIYNKNINLKINCSDPNASVFYTTDGSIPIYNKSYKYANSIYIDSLSIIRATAFCNGKKSKIYSKTYFINNTYTLPFVSVITDPKNLWSSDSGIYLSENNSKTPFWGANFWKNWTKNAHISYFEANGDLKLSQEVSFKIYDDIYKTLPQKSFQLIANNNDGQYFKYNFFDEKNPSKIKSIVLKNSGYDWYSTLFRGALLNSIISDFNIENQSTKHCIVYLNGKYWGIYNLRENIDKDFIKSNSNNVSLLKYDRFLNNENYNEDFNQLIKFIQFNDFNSKQNYDSINKLIDIDNFINYMIVQIYFDKNDIKENGFVWKNNYKSGKWRWLFYDNDWGFGLYSEKAYENNTLKIVTQDNGNVWNSPTWSTLLLRKLLENKNFKFKFINSFADAMNSDFKSEKILPKIDYFYNSLRFEIYRHYGKWGGNVEKWNNNIENLKNFATYRPKFMREFLVDKFKIRDTIVVKINIPNNNGGYVVLNSINISDKKWEGIYYANIPVNLKIKERFGHYFENWTGSINDTLKNIYVPLIDSVSLTANFIKNPISDKYQNIVITEICYENSVNSSCEWIEIYNLSEKNIDISSWFIEDKIGNFKITSKNILKSKDYFIITNNLDAFSNQYPKISKEKICFIDNLKIENINDFICLYDNKEQLVDSVNIRFLYTHIEGKNTGTVSINNLKINHANSRNWEYVNLGNPGIITSNSDVKINWDNKFLNFFKTNYLAFIYSVGILIITIFVIIFTIKLNRREKKVNINDVVSKLSNYKYKHFRDRKNKRK